MFETILLTFNHHTHSIFIFKIDLKCLLIKNVYFIKYEIEKYKRHLYDENNITYIICL